MKKLILGVLAVGLLGLIALIAMQPGVMEVSRTIQVAATPADVLAYAHDLKKVNEWSPWHELDPGMKQEYSESTSGVGAWYHWTSDHENVGEGKMTIEVADATRTETKLEFIAPFQSQAKSTTDWGPSGDGTRVTWGFQSDADFMMKAVNLFMDIEGSVGADYDRGLAMLKPLVEDAAKQRVAAEQAAAEAAAKAAEGEDGAEAAAAAEGEDGAEEAAAE